MASCDVDSSQEIDNDMFGDCLKNNITDVALCESSGVQNCSICNLKLCSPRILSCLHVFCEACLDKLLVDESADTGENCERILCPLCKQVTQINDKGVSSLIPDYISACLLDPLAADNVESIHCTSCKSKEEAVAYCKDCSNFLCSNCNIAHKFMRCFENHTVLNLSNLDGQNLSIHKPIYCVHHKSEHLKFFCFTCQVPICNECLEKEHTSSDHHFEDAKTAEFRIRKELESLIKESRSKGKFCERTTATLESALEDLQQQHDTAKDLITESFHSYKAILEKCKVNALNKLDQLHSERELKIMDIFHNLDETVEKIESACNFTSRLLQHGNCYELITLKQMISTQLLKLINNTPKPEVSFSIEFETDIDKFENSIKNSFGKFQTEDTRSESPVPTLTNLNPSLNHTNSSGIGMSNRCSTSLTTSSPISLPTSMQSSFDSELSTISTSLTSNFNIASNGLPVDTTSANMPVATGLQLSSIAEYNLQQLASLAEKTDAVSASNASSPSPSFSLADLFTGDISSTNNVLNNLQALAKLGLNGTDLSTSVLPTVPPRIDSVDNVQAMDLPSSMISPIPIDLNIVNHSSPVPTTGNIINTRANGNVKLTPMQIRCKFGQLGATKGQFNSPHGFCLGLEEDIIVADTNNHRIEVFDKTGTFKFQFGFPGKEEGQLWYPRKVAVMRTSGKFVVCDRGNERSRMQIFTKNGHFIKKIGIRYIDIVAGLAVTVQGHIVAVDSVSPTVFVIAESGDLLHWFDCSDYMREPSDIAINGKEYFVCDFKGHCVVVFSEEGIFQRRIGGENITNFPNGIDISDAGDVLIGDSHGNRFHVAVFSRDGTLVSEFECPYVKVSRCCGLKITSEGYVVTLAKNNHHVLVLNTLYIL